MEIGTVLYQQDVQGIPKPTFQGAVEVKSSDPDVDAVAKWAVQAYNDEQGTHLQFVSTVMGWKKPLNIVGTLYLILLKANDGQNKTKVYLTAVFVTPLKNLLLLFVYIAG